ncbi:MAG: hypothetical protein WBG46_04635 [Nonlabens sp.]
MKFVFSTLFFLCSIQVFTQSLNEYKYFIVSNQYDFQNEENQYRLNDLMVFELKKRGFKAFKSNQIHPEDKNTGVCNTLNVNLEESGMLTRRIIFKFVNCDGETIFTTKEGIGRQKDNPKAYFSAVRDAMTSLDKFDYNYTPTAKIQQEKLTSLDQMESKSQPIVLEPQILKQPIGKQSIAIPNHDIYREIKDRDYALRIISNTEIKILKNGKQIGTGKKTSSGAYLINSDNFSGVGFLKDDIFTIEYEVQGELKKLIFKKN